MSLHWNLNGPKFLQNEISSDVSRHSKLLVQNCLPYWFDQSFPSTVVIRWINISFLFKVATWSSETANTANNIVFLSFRNALRLRYMISLSKLFGAISYFCASCSFVYFCFLGSFAFNSVIRSAFMFSHNCRGYLVSLVTDNRIWQRTVDKSISEIEYSVQFEMYSFYVWEVSILIFSRLYKFFFCYMLYFWKGLIFLLVRGFVKSSITWTRLRIWDAIEISNILNWKNRKAQLNGKG